MTLKNRLTYNRWNIGFIEASVRDIIIDDQQEVHWVKHNMRDRFLADPFILDHDDAVIRVLVEDFPYDRRKGLISLLTIDRHTYELLDKRILLDMPYHQSYPYILRMPDGSIKVLPEASQSGALWIYDWDGNSLINRQLLINEPLLDSTIHHYNNKWWLFATKRGQYSNWNMFVYVSDRPDGGYRPVYGVPAVSDPQTARPAGYLIDAGGNRLMRATQKCDLEYGERVNITQVEQLDTDAFNESFVKTLKPRLGEFSKAFHTLNEYQGLTVIDGVRSEFRPFSKLYYTLKSKL